MAMSATAHAVNASSPADPNIATAMAACGIAQDEEGGGCSRSSMPGRIEWEWVSVRMPRPSGVASIMG